MQGIFMVWLQFGVCAIKPTSLPVLYFINFTVLYLHG